MCAVNDCFGNFLLQVKKVRERHETLLGCAASTTAAAFFPFAKKVTSFCLPLFYTFLLLLLLTTRSQNGFPIGGKTERKKETTTTPRFTLSHSFSRSEAEG